MFCFFPRRQSIWALWASWALGASRVLWPLRALPLLCCLCLGGGCGARSDIHAQAQDSAPLVATTLPSGPLWVSVEESSEHASSMEDFRSLLTALLQSDAGIRLADSAQGAACILRVQILQVGLASSEDVGMNMEQGFGSALSGAMLGLAVGSGTRSRSGALWGAGAGMALGLGVGYARNSNNSADTWSMLADVALSCPAKGTKNSPSSKKQSQNSQSRMAVTAEGTNLTREAAIPALEDALAQKIVHYFSVPEK